MREFDKNFTRKLENIIQEKYGYGHSKDKFFNCQVYKTNSGYKLITSIDILDGFGYYGGTENATITITSKDITVNGWRTGSLEFSDYEKQPYIYLAKDFIKAIA